MLANADSRARLARARRDRAASSQRRVAATAAVAICSGYFLTFAPQFYLGYHGMPRRYPNYPPEFRVFNVWSTAGYALQMVGFLTTATYLVCSIINGKKAGPNPWGATGLEWAIPSPPITHNFEKTPIVVAAPYEYSLNLTQTGEKADVL